MGVAIPIHRVTLHCYIPCDDYECVIAVFLFIRSKIPICVHRLCC